MGGTPGDLGSEGADLAKNETSKFRRHNPQDLVGIVIYMVLVLQYYFLVYLGHWVHSSGYIFTFLKISFGGVGAKKISS